jgi:hypothetical protein
MRKSMKRKKEKSSRDKMTNLPSQHPTLSLHLTDLTLTPLISSSSSQSHLESLTSLTTTALTGQAAIQRINLGAPQRVMVEYPDRGALVLQSYLDPAASTASATTATASHHSSSRPETPHQGHHSRPDTANGDGGGGGGDLRVSSSHGKGKSPARQPDAVISPEDAPPMLVSVVVAGSADQAHEARRAAEKLERVGREFQREWLEDSSGRGNEEA